MPFNIFGRRPSRKEAAPTEPLITDPAPTELLNADPNCRMVLDIVDQFFMGCKLPYSATVFRTSQVQARQKEFTVRLPRPFDPGFTTHDICVKIKQHADGRTVAHLSMPETKRSKSELPSPGRLYNWPMKLKPVSKSGPILAVVEDSVAGQWLSMAMHLTFRGDDMAWRMTKTIEEQGGKVGVIGPRPNDVYALGCEKLWSVGHGR
ncbi:hypothetical protein ACHAPT_009929 [Fusarium lateritium]